jgi:hypothetical protein
VEDSGGEKFHGGHTRHMGVLALAHDAVNRYKVGS